MSKKDYIALAAALKMGIATTDDSGWDDRTFPYLIADVLRADNPSFDEQRFLAACGLEA